MIISMIIKFTVVIPIVDEIRITSRYCDLFERVVEVITAVNFRAMDLAMRLKPFAESNQESYRSTFNPENMIMRQLSLPSLDTTMIVTLHIFTEKDSGTMWLCLNQ